VPNYTTKYGFGRMDVGEIAVFAVPDIVTIPRIRSAASDFGRRHSKEFATKVLRAGTFLAVKRVA